MGHQGPDNAGRRVELAAALALGAGEHAQEVFVDLAQLLDPGRLLALVGDQEAAVTPHRLAQAIRLAGQLCGSGAGRTASLQRLLAGVTVHQDRVTLHVNLSAIGAAADEFNALSTSIEVPIRLKRCGMAVRLMVQAPDGESIQRGRSPDQKLVAVLSKAHDWFARLASGDADSVQAIVQQEHMSRWHVSRVIQLAFLAPDLVERIARGEHSVELNVDRLMRLAPLPLAWEDQRKLLGDLVPMR